MANPFPPKRKAKEDSLQNLLPLSVVVSVAPFNQDDWTSIPARAKAASDSIGPLASLFTPNPAIPFSQDLWEGAAKPKTRAVGEVIAAVSPLFNPNPSSPFSQDVWDSAAFPRKSVPADTVELLLPFFGNAPFTGLTETRTTRRQAVKSDIVVNLLPIQTLPIATIPFSQEDWTNAVGCVSTAKVDLIERSSALFTPNPGRPFITDPVMASLSASRSRAALVDASVNLLPIQNPPSPPSPTSGSWLPLMRRRLRR